MIARIERDGERVTVRSPGVGQLTGLPQNGALVGEGAVIGRLRVLGRTYEVTLPPGVAGIVGERGHRDHRFSVAHGQTLLVLTPIAADGVSRVDDAAGEGPDGLVQRATSDGVFYLRPSPDAPPFVEAGARLTRGQPIGLLEVMKTFSQVLYGGEGLPETATVDEVLVDDAVEIEAGQPILRLR